MSEEKKKIIQENSKAIVLNSDIIDKYEWNINNIENRFNNIMEGIDGGKI